VRDLKGRSFEVKDVEISCVLQALQHVAGESAARQAPPHGRPEKSSDQMRFAWPQVHSEALLINHQRVPIPLDCDICHEAAIEMF
jgi:hypothetical protein